MTFRIRLRWVFSLLRVENPPFPRLDGSEAREFGGPPAAQRANDPIHYAIHLVRRVAGSYPLPAGFMICQFRFLHTPRE
jgi:hypothetical protein